MFWDKPILDNPAVARRPGGMQQPAMGRPSMSMAAGGGMATPSAPPSQGQPLQHIPGLAPLRKPQVQQPQLRGNAADAGYKSKAGLLKSFQDLNPVAKKP